MEKLINWLEVLDWQEIGRVFVVMSIIAVFVSCVINKSLKNLPVLAVQLSILATLAIYPMINLYSLAASGYEGFEITDRVDPAHYGALVFLTPLPVCIFTAAAFFVFRNRKTEKKISRQRNITRLIVKIVPCILSLTIGGVWLSISMLFAKGKFHTTVAVFMFYTILGFIMYLASEIVLLIVKRCEKLKGRKNEIF